MKKRSLGLLSAIATFAVAMSFMVASCDNNATDPANSGGNRGRGKGPQVSNSDQARTVGVARVGNEGSQLDYDYETTDLTVENFNGGGIRTIPDQPGIVWSQSIRANWDDQGGLELLSISDDIGETSSLVLQQEGEAMVTIPTFTGGSSEYRLELQDNGRTIGSIPGLNIGDPVIIYPVNPGNPCCRAMNSNGFVVNPATGACIWRVTWDPCCYWRYTAPDGTVYEFNGINYIEGVEDEHYPYHNFSEIRVLPRGSGVENFVVTSEYVTAQ